MKKKILFFSVIILLAAGALWGRFIYISKNTPPTLEGMDKELTTFANILLKKGYAVTDGNLILVPSDWTSEKIKWFETPSVVKTEGWQIYTLTKHGKQMEKIVIPEEVDGKPIVAIGTAAFFHCPNLVSVTIPDTVQRAAAKAFAFCPKLKSITSSADFFNAVEGAYSPVFAGCHVSEWNYTGDGLDVEFGFVQWE